MILWTTLNIRCSREQALKGPWGSGRLRLPDICDFRHYEGGKVVTPTHRPSLPPGVSWYSFLEAESTPGHMIPSVATEKIPSHTTGDRSRDPPTKAKLNKSTKEQSETPYNQSEQRFSSFFVRAGVFTPFHYCGATNSDVHSL